MSTTPSPPDGPDEEDPSDEEFIKGLEPRESTGPKTRARRKSTLTKPLLFTGTEPATAPLVFQGSSPQLDDIETEDSISDSVWEMIRSGKIIGFLPPYLLETDNIEKLLIKQKDQNSCKMRDGGTDKITIIKNTNGSLGFVVDSSKQDGIEPIRLMIATAKCAAELEINLRIERMLGHPPSEKEAKEAREEILKANPKLLRFTINTCANAKDVALMLIEMKNGAPKLEATLTPAVIAAVSQGMGTLSLAHRKVIQEQLSKQNPPPPSPPSAKPN